MRLPRRISGLRSSVVCLPFFCALCLSPQSPITNHQSPFTFHLSPFASSARGSPRVIDKPWHETMFVMVFAEQKKGGFKRVKIPLLFLGLFLTLSVISEAGPARGGFSRGGFSGRSFHTGFAPRGFNRGGRRFAFRNRGIRFQQYAWPLYWYPYGYPYDDSLDYSYLEPDSSPDYQYWDNSSGYVQPRSTNSVAPQRPVIIVINNGNARVQRIPANR